MQREQNKLSAQSLARLARRYRTLAYYSGGEPKCECCGESRIEFLSIDHVDGGGTKHRAEIGRNTRMFDWLAQNGYPLGYRVLCHNCNLAHGYYGKCPHQSGEFLRPMLQEYFERPQIRGSKHHMAKLNEAEVLEIRQRSADGESHSKLALTYGVSRAAIFFVVNKRNWAHV